MKFAWMLIAALVLVPAAVAQKSIPPGTLIPVSLSTGLNAAKLHPGERIQARVMQDIPGTPVRRHNRVIGHVIKVSSSHNSSHNGQCRLEIAFDSIKTHQGEIQIRANLRAMASMMDVLDAGIPEEGASRGITPEVATTEQIGGEQVYRGGGPVTYGDTVVGEPLPYGVLGVPRANNERGCRGVVADNDQPQALWLFSTNACGLYGFPGLEIQHRGRTSPEGEISLKSTTSRLKVSAGTGILLRIEQPQNGNL